MRLALCGKECTGCNKFCIYNVMSSLENMLIKCKIITSCIGEYAGEDSFSREPLIVTGMMIDRVEGKRDNPISKLLGSTDKTFSKQPVFHKYLDNGVADLFKEYLDEKYNSNAEKVVNYKKEILERLIKLQKGEVFILPVSVDRKVDYIDKGEVNTGVIIRIDYRIDKETCGIKTSIKIKDWNYSIVEKRFNSFCKDWWVRGIEHGCIEADRNLIEMSDNGVVKPINMNNNIIIDNLYIYKNRGSKFEIIGKADKDGYKLHGLREEELKEKEVQKLRKNLTYLSHMQRVIGVYGLNEEKKVEV